MNEKKSSDWLIRPIEHNDCFGRRIPEHRTIERLIFDVNKLVRLALLDLSTEHYTMHFLYVMIPFVEPPVEGPEYYRRVVAMFARDVINAEIDMMNAHQLNTE